LGKFQGFKGYFNRLENKNGQIILLMERKLLENFKNGSL